MDAWVSPAGQEYRRTAMHTSYSYIYNILQMYVPCIFPAVYVSIFIYIIHKNLSSST
jgi:hypothetical protein